MYSGFEAGVIDSISVINLNERLERLTARDLRQLETHVPLDTLKTVVDLAVEIGREGREGQAGRHAVRHRRHPQSAGHEPSDRLRSGARLRPQGAESERSARPRRAEGSGPDGRGVHRHADGTVEAANRYIDAPATNITLSKGLAPGIGPPPRSPGRPAAWPWR